MSKLIIKAINNPWLQEDLLAQRLNRLKSLAFNFTEVEFNFGVDFFLANFQPVIGLNDSATGTNCGAAHQDKLVANPAIKETIDIFNQLVELIKLLNARMALTSLFGVGVNPNELAPADLVKLWQEVFLPAVEKTQLTKDFKQLWFEFFEQAEQGKFIPQSTYKFYFLTEIRREKLFYKLSADFTGLDSQSLARINEDLGYWVKQLQESSQACLFGKFTATHLNSQDLNLVLELAATIYFKILLLLKELGIGLNLLPNLLLPAFLRDVLTYNEEELVYELIHNYLLSYYFKADQEQLDSTEVNNSESESSSVFVLC